MARSDLPFGSEFSPAQIDLANLLELAHEHGPDWKAFENAVRERYFSAHRTEVDLIFESARLVFSRWQVQCKNTARVSVDDVAKEVGLTHLLRSNVVVMVSTGRIGDEARRYANKIMAESNLCIVMIDGADLSRIEARPAQVVDVFNRESRHAMALKQLGWHCAHPPVRDRSPLRLADREEHR